jgi:hypothetical protein
VTTTIKSETVKRLRENLGVRYFLASLAGLASRLRCHTGLSIISPGWTSPSLRPSAFCLVGSVFYLVHEFWTFRQEASRFSARRMIANICVLLLSGTVRVAMYRCAGMGAAPRRYSGSAPILPAGVARVLHYELPPQSLFRVPPLTRSVSRAA